MHPKTSYNILEVILNYKHKILICVPILLAICFVLMWQFPNVASDDGKVAWWYSVVPPLIAITLAVITTRLFLSLGVAVGAGLLLAWTQQGLSLSTFFSEVVWFARAVTVGNDGIDLFNLWVILFVFFYDVYDFRSDSVRRNSKCYFDFISPRERTSLYTIHHRCDGGQLSSSVDYSNAMLVGPTMPPYY